MSSANQAIADTFSLNDKVYVKRRPYGGKPEGSYHWGFILEKTPKNAKIRFPRKKGVKTEVLPWDRVHRWDKHAEEIFAKSTTQKPASSKVKRIEAASEVDHETPGPADVRERRDSQMVPSGSERRRIVRAKASLDQTGEVSSTISSDTDKGRKVLGLGFDERVDLCLAASIARLSGLAEGYRKTGAQYRIEAQRHLDEADLIAAEYEQLEKISGFTRIVRLAKSEYQRLLELSEQKISKANEEEANAASIERVTREQQPVPPTQK